MNPDELELIELGNKIGISDEMTEMVLLRLRNMDPSTSLLSTCSILLLERFDETIPIIISILKKELDFDFLALLQESKYYIHRRSVPVILTELDFPGKDELILKSLSDPIIVVVKEAVLSIMKNNIFNDDKLSKIFSNLLSSNYTAIKMMSIDVLTLIGENTILLVDLLRINNWRMRLKIASRLESFKIEDQEKIIFEIKNDIVEEVRIELSKQLKSLKFIEVLNDRSEIVRANYLSNVISQIEDENILKKLIDDDSWKVKKILLNLHGDMFKKITIPLIKNNDDADWRIKLEILDLVEKNINNEYVTKLMMAFLIRNLRNKVFEIRKKIQDILVSIINTYPWVNEYFYEIEEITFSQNYLFRITSIPVSCEYDTKYGTQLSKKFEKDPVINVVDFYNEYLRHKNGWISEVFSDKVDDSVYY